MTIELFIFMLTIGAAASSFLTQALKKAFKNISCNVLALLDAILVGFFGTCIAYGLMGVPFTLKNILCVVLMTVCVWVGSMIGYDKVIQMIDQIKKGWDYV